MDRVQYNQCIRSKLTADEIKKLPEPQAKKFCIGAKLCTGKAKTLAEAMKFCEGVQGRRGRGKIREVTPSKMTDAQKSVMKVLGECQITHVHGDGDLTLDCGGYGYVATTDGRIFKEVGLR